MAQKIDHLWNGSRRSDLQLYVAVVQRELLLDLSKRLINIFILLGCLLQGLHARELVLAAFFTEFICSKRE